MKGINNLRYDRVELDGHNMYNTYRGTEERGMTEYEGFLKCKLIHSKGLSLIVPDLIYIMDNVIDFSWIQFYSFMPNDLAKLDDDNIVGSVYIDISFGQTIQVKFFSQNHIKNFYDNSNLFKCTIIGPSNLSEYYTGKGKLLEGTPYIYLYHHTSDAAKDAILESSNFRGSAWNFQGTKELENISYAYFTSLDKIRTPEDLFMIAMSTNEIINLITDITDEIIAIKVYRESTDNRPAVIKRLVNSTILSNNHIWMHNMHPNVYYEPCGPFIYRVGLLPNTILSFNDEIIVKSDNIKLTGYIVLGDASTKDGIIAPFDEENTTHLFKIEPFLDNDTNILEFWFNNGNKDLYSHKDVELQKFKSK